MSNFFRNKQTQKKQHKNVPCYPKPKKKTQKQIIDKKEYNKTCPNGHPNRTPHWFQCPRPERWCDHPRPSVSREVSKASRIVDASLRVAMGQSIQSMGRLDESIPLGIKLSSWWFQPIWKILVKLDNRILKGGWWFPLSSPILYPRLKNPSNQLDHVPNFGGEHKHCLKPPSRVMFSDDD